MQQLWNAANAGFNAVTVTFTAIEKVATMADNFASVGVIKSETYLAEAKHDQAIAHEEFEYERAKRRVKLEGKLAALKREQSAPALPAPSAP